jgi:transcriptional regulator of acetoin/glycerol metabolism
VAVNCAALPETLIESELFGYGPGAFTGAKKDGRKGKIAQSSGGTLFLDEIGDMPLLLQTRLLRVLEELEVMPLGAETGIPVDLRVICASNQDLRELLAAGAFREDLYYRLNGIMLELPALRARTDKDVLIRHILAEESGVAPAESIDAAALECLEEHAWPGNIRELRNVIRSAWAICDDRVIRLCDLPQQLHREEISRVRNTDTNVDTTTTATHTNIDVTGRAACGGPTTPPNPLAHAERDALLGAIRASRGNLCNTAKQLGISRNALYRKLKRHGIAVSRVDGLSVRGGTDH